QFRTLETRLGLKRENRLKYNQSDYDQALKPEHRAGMGTVENEASLFDVVEKWLERTPFLKMQGFDFWQTYKNTVETTLQNDLNIIQNNAGLHEEDRKRNQMILEGSLSAFRALFDEKAYGD